MRSCRAKEKFLRALGYLLHVKHSYNLWSIQVNHYSPKPASVKLKPTITTTATSTSTKTDAEPGQVRYIQTTRPLNQKKKNHLPSFIDLTNKHKLQPNFPVRLQTEIANTTATTPALKSPLYEPPIAAIFLNMLLLFDLMKLPHPFVTVSSAASLTCTHLITSRLERVKHVKGFPTYEDR